MLFELDIDFDKDKLLQECFSCEFEDFKSSVERGDFFDHIPQWQRAKAVGEETERVKSILEKRLGCSLMPKFFIMDADFELPFHKDETPSLSVNILLKGESPITFKEHGDIFYEAAVLDIKQEHKVKASSEERIILKMPSFDAITFDEARENYEVSR